MSLKDSEKVMDIIFQDILPFYVVLTGGEPLKNIPVLKKFMGSFKEKGMKYSINSNLTLLNEGNLSEILEVDNSFQILASIPSLERKVHKKVTGKDNLPLLLRNLKRASKAGIEIIPNMVVHGLNKDQVYEQGKILSQEYGLTQFCVTPMLRPAKRIEPLYLTNEEMVKPLENLIRLKEDFGIKINTLEVIPRCALPEELRDQETFHRTCTAGGSNFMVGYEGNIRACGHSPFSEGNLLEEGFSTIWEKMKPFRDNTYIPGECEACIEINTCKGGCKFEGFSEEDSLGKPDSRMTKPITRNAIIPEIIVDESRKYDLRIFNIREENEGNYTLYNGNALFVNEGFKKFVDYISSKGYFSLKEMPLEAREKAEGLAKILIQGGFLK